ncbi:methylenetetrahydrofolate reductase [Candidatus Methanomassiliicoccus intestinalis]|uniref:methylenetetrahydrofolate reductase n=1 Tax=Candidatus Methanomassiliicoccus intestinalis TaxID=1406512 RepID=UPI0037DC6E2A
MISKLQQVLDEGKFAVTAEISPPKSASCATIRQKAQLLKDYVDAVNLTDNQTAIVRVSSFAASLACLQEGVEPIMQMTCRDRNRLAMQSDVLGAAAFGIRNVMCLSGDHQVFGNQPQAKNVYDLDSIQQLLVFNKLRNEGQVWGGDALKEKPTLFLGAAANPFADPFAFRVTRLAKKIAAGADFIQTQAVFDLERFQAFMEEVVTQGLDQKVHILAGVMPLKSLAMARHMQNNVSGITLPPELLQRLEAAEDVPAEGLAICRETIAELKKIKGVHGVHIMAIAWESMVPQIIEDAGLRR